MHGEVKSEGQQQQQHQRKNEANNSSSSSEEEHCTSVSSSSMQQQKKKRLHHRELQRHLSIRIVSNPGMSGKRVTGEPATSEWTWRDVVVEVFQASHGFPRWQEFVCVRVFTDGGEEEVVTTRAAAAATAAEETTEDHRESGEREEMALVPCDETQHHHGGVGLCADASGQQQTHSNVSHETISRIVWSAALIIDIVMRSIGQVFICDNPLSGLLMLIGVGICDPWYAFFTVLGAVCGNLGALFTLRSVTPDVCMGLFGYDAVLLANALYTFLDDPTSARGVWLIIFGCVFAGLARCSVGTVMSQCKLPTATITFCSLTVCILYCVAQAHPLGLGLRVSFPPVPPPAEPSFSSVMSWSVIGFGQVIFASNLAGSILVVLGIAVYSRLGAMGGIAGGVVGTLFGLYVLPSATNLDAISQGLFSYNGALTGMALSIGVFIQISKPLDVFVPLIGAVSATTGQIVARAILPAAVPICTFPFVFTMYILLPALTHRLVATPTTTSSTPTGAKANVDEEKTIALPPLPSTSPSTSNNGVSIKNSPPSVTSVGGVSPAERKVHPEGSMGRGGRVSMKQLHASPGIQNNESNPLLTTNQRSNLSTGNVLVDMEHVEVSSVGDGE